MSGFFFGGGGVIATTCMIKAPKGSEFLKELLTQAKMIIHQELKYRFVMPIFSHFTLRAAIVNKIIEWLPRSLKYRFFSHKQRIAWGVIGPAFLENQIKQNPVMQVYVVSPATFCDIDWFRAKDFILKSQFPHPSEVYVAHVWNAMWEGYQLEKDVRYPKESLIEKMRSSYVPKKFLDSLPCWDETMNDV